jgi:uncharacterized protein YndB with AHSA1/START domain
MPNTVRLHRVLAAKPEKVYRAFIEADALAKWLPPNGFACTVHQLDAKVGGTFRMSFRNFTTDNSHSFGGEYIELVPHERLRYTDKFDDPNLPGQIQVTVTLKKVSLGTELSIVQEGLPDAIPPEACYLGWQESLRNLACITALILGADDEPLREATSCNADDIAYVGGNSRSRCCWAGREYRKPF